MKIPKGAPVTRRQLLGLGAAGALGAGYVGFGERYLFGVNHYPVAIRDLPPSLEGTRILQISDLHYGFLMGRYSVKRVLRKAQKVAADMIVLTGDYVGHPGGFADLQWVLDRFGELEARHGVHAVLGNHDHWAGSTDKAVAQMERLGISLHHRRHAIEAPDGRLWLAGAGDLWEDLPRIDEVLDGVPEDEPRIVLAHNPDTADVEWSARVDLMMSGHTHGGQVVIPFLGAPKLPVRNKRYSSGLIRAAKTQLFITRGLGWAILPVRFNCPPELAVLVLSRA